MQVEDILPLSPLQEGLLFHAHYDAQAHDVYTVQLVLALQGPLDRRRPCMRWCSAMRSCARPSATRTSAGRSRSFSGEWRLPGKASICRC